MGLKNYIKRNIPLSYKASLLNIKHISLGVYYTGNRFECSCCGWRFRQLLTYGNPARSDAQCPRCRSLERHRWLMLYLRQKIASSPKRQKLLHFAPASALGNKLANHSKIAYYGTDVINASQYDLHLQMDIHQLAIAPESIDIIICNHVLEHIPDDHLAMRELFRILKPKGWMIASVPIRLDQPTYEDATIQSPQARLKAYGQHDHVRFYGYDFPDRLENAGFNVTMEQVASMEQHLIDRYRLNSDEVFFIAEKP